MRDFQFARTAFSIGLMATMAACSAQQSTATLPQAGVESKGAALSTRSASTVPYLFAASNNRRGKRGFLSVYNPGQKTPALSIDEGINQPNGLVIDGSGNLYVADNAWTGGTGAVIEYAAGTSKIVRKITAGVNTPDWVTLDASGNLYVANFLANTVTVYGPTGTQPLRTISDGITFPEDIEFDSAGNVFVVNFANSDQTGSVTEYAPNGTEPLATITHGINSPGYLVFNAAKDTMYVSNIGTNSITVYNASTLKLTRTITDDIHYPTRMIFDASENLYVQDTGYGEDGGVLVFAKGASSPKEIITKGVKDPTSIALDVTGNLYVGNLKQGNFFNGRFNRGSVAVYAPGKVTPSYEIRDGLDGVVDLALGPNL
jgi:sugar lactone lactonase YvrE